MKRKDMKKVRRALKQQEAASTRKSFLRGDIVVRSGVVGWFVSRRMAISRQLANGQWRCCWMTSKGDARIRDYSTHQLRRVKSWLDTTN